MVEINAEELTSQIKDLLIGNIIYEIDLYGDIMEVDYDKTAESIAKSIMKRMENK